jgi:osmoprotectant transport system permease protein
MHFLHQVFSWFADGSHWTGSGGIPILFLNQLKLSAAVVAAAVLIGGGAGMILGHTGRGSLVAVNAANAFRAVPTLALLTLLAIYPPIGLRWGGFLCSFVALTVLAIPPILTNTYVGVREVDADVTDASRAMGLTGAQILGRVELPLALPFIMAGIRTAAIEVVATSTLAAEVFFSDLGTPIIAGLNSNDTVEAFCGAILVAVMAALVALVLGALLKLTTPPGMKVGKRAGSLLTSAPAVDAVPLRSA